MKQITEDYVSYENAVLLKEKGFDEYCLFCYEQNVFSHTTNFTLKRALYRDILIGIKNSEFEENAIHNVFTAPSQSIALKWLREVHKIVIEINMEDYITEIDGKLTITYSYTIWHFNRHLNEVGKDDIRYTDEAIWDKESHDSYEEAVEAALKYTLENLT